MADVFKMLDKIAEANKDNPLFQTLDKYAKELPIQPGGVGGFTKQEAAKNVVRKLFPRFAMEEFGGGQTWINPSPTAGLSKEMSDLLRVIAKTPKKATEQVKEFKFWPAKGVTGKYNPEAINIFPAEEFPHSMAGTYAHEAGHGASIPMFGKMLFRKFKTRPAAGEAAKTGMLGYMREAYQEPLEGVAEYLGQHIQKQAGIPAKPYFGYGTEQIETFNKLSQMPSKNPYMNVYRYLKELSK